MWRYFGGWPLFFLLWLAIVDGALGYDGNKTKMEGGGLFWNDLSVQTPAGNYLLHHFNGFIPDGHICGILGPSGAGKSTTLSALGDTISSQSGLVVTGDILYYNVDTQTTEHLQVRGGRVAWLQQKDKFFNMLTVEETLDLAAFLDLPQFTEKQRTRRIQKTMDSLGLTKLKDRRIGDSAMHHGLSGGEKRRLSLALELLSSPKFFIGDEPTSGLDSTLSEKVVTLIRKLVKEREIPCILSLHQPRSSIWRMLDSVILMAPGGRVCYFGPTKSAVSYFSKLGYKCPSETNPAEFLLDLVSIDSEDPRAAGEDEARIMKLASAFAENQDSVIKPKIPENAIEIDQESIRLVSGKRRRGFRLQRFARLLMRSWRQNIRNHRVNLLRLFVSAGNAYLFTNVFKSIQKGMFTAKSVADRTALLTFGIVNMTMAALMKTIDLFAKEKPVVRREQQRKLYSSLEYLLSKSLAEIPLDSIFAAIFTTVLKSTSGIRIGWQALTATFTLMTVCGASLGFAIGSLSPTAEIAMSSGVPLIVLLMSVGIINPSGVDPENPPPAIVESLKTFSPIAYAIRAVCIAEYRGAIFQSPHKGGFFRRGRNMLKDLPRMGALALVQNGDQVLDELGLGSETYEGAMKHLVFLSATNLLISWIGLHVQASSDGPSKR